MKRQSDIQRIMVPHDFSDTADYAFGYALDLARKLGARVTVVHVCDVVPYAYPDAYFAGYEDFASEVERAANEALTKVATAARSENHQIETVLRRGSAWQEINSIATEIKADLIVMGTHGRKGFGRLLLGSVAEKVVRTASCPLLTLHLPQADRAAEVRAQNPV